jgi:beta-glucosidase
MQLMKKFYLLAALLLGMTLTGYADGKSAAPGEPFGLKRATTATPRENPDAAKKTGWHRRYDACRQQIAKGGVEIVVIGDSIAHFWEKDAAKDKRRFGGLATFKKYLSNYNVLNLANAGDRTQHAVWITSDSKLLDNIDPKLAVIMIGTNNLSGKPQNKDSEEAIAAGISKVVSNIRTKLPNAKVLVFGIFPRSANAQHHNRKKIITINNIIRKLADDKNVFYCDITAQLLKADGNLSKEIMPDYLHPNDKGYEVWANAMLPYVHKFVGKK